MLLNAEKCQSCSAAFTISELVRENQQGTGNGGGGTD